MRRLMIKLLLSTWLLCLMMSPIGQKADADDRMTLRVGYLPILTQLPVIVSYENDRMNLNRLHLEVVKYKSFTSLEAALRVGAIDIASIPVPIALSIAADDYKIKIVGTMHTGGSRLMAKDPGDLKSMRGNLIGVPGLDTGENLILDRILEKAGLRQGLDYKTIGVPFNSAIGDLKIGRLNAAYLPEPYGTIAEKQGVGVMVKGHENQIAGNPGCVIVVHTEVLEKNRPAVEEWLTSLVKSCRVIEKDIKESGANQIAIIQETYFNFPKDIVIESLSQRRGGLRFDQFVPSLEGIRENLKKVSQMKMITKSVDLDSIAAVELMDKLAKTGTKT